MLTKIFKGVDKIWTTLTSNWSYCKLCMKKDIALAILVLLLIWSLV